MANETHVYFFREDILRSRYVEADPLTRIPLPEWLKQRPDSDQLWQELLRDTWGDTNSGVQHITCFRRGVGTFPDLDKLSIYHPSLKERFKPVGYLELPGSQHPLVAYDKGADFPPGYESWLTAIDCPGWQFFTYAEMTEILGICGELVRKGLSPFEKPWRELISAQKTQVYDLALFTHEI